MDRVPSHIEKVLEEIEQEVQSGKRFLPTVGPKKGRFLYIVTKAIGAKKVLDLGTLVGYSAILFSSAVGSKGRIITTEKDLAMVKEAKENFKKARVKNIRLMEKDAKYAIKKVKGHFDLVFLDVWKEEYVTLLPLCIKRLRKGGVLIANNVLWNTKGMQTFRNMLEKNKSLETVLVPIQDGLSFSVKR